MGSVNMSSPPWTCTTMRQWQRRHLQHPTCWAFFSLLCISAVVPPPRVWASSMENVYITSTYDQLVTSSTLRWKSTSSDEVFYRHPTVIRNGPSSVCRGWYMNQPVPGGTDGQGKCAVGFFDELHRLDNFQVLVDGTSMARLEWFDWDIFTKLPIGLVAYTEDKAFVARYQDPDSQKWYFGDLKPRRGLSGDIAVFFSKDKMIHAKKGEILMEVEPVRYLLQDIQYHTQRSKIHKEPIHLGSRILSKDVDDLEDDGESSYPSSSWSRIRSVIAYNASYSYYWGQSEGMMKALPSSATSFTHNKKINFKWGLPLTYDRHRILEVPADLQAGTSIQISASAQRTTKEVPYSGKLVYIYADGTNKKRKLNGTYIETLLSDVRTEYGRPYFTHNGTYAPTTTTTSTTPSPTTPSKETTVPNLPARMGSAWPQHSMRESSSVLASTTPRPRRTTEPLPTSTNPLLRFYPTMRDSSAEEEAMQSDEATSRGRRPMTESLSSRASLAQSPDAALLTWPIVTMLVSLASLTRVSTLLCQ